MNKKILIITCCILISATIAGCSNSIAKVELPEKEKVNNLDFEFEVNPENFQLAVKIYNKKDIKEEMTNFEHSSEDR